MSQDFTADQVERLGQFVDALTEICSEHGFTLYSYDHIYPVTFAGHEPFGAHLWLEGNDDDGYEYRLRFQ